MPPTLHPDFTMTKLGVILIFIGTFWLHLSKRLAERQADEDTTANPREKKRAEPLKWANRACWTKTACRT